MACEKCKRNTEKCCGCNIACCQQCRIDSTDSYICNNINCATLPQPVSPPDPNLNLNGQNRMACYNNKVVNTNISNLNCNIEIMNNCQLNRFLSTPITATTINLSLAQYTPDPFVNPVGCNLGVFVPIPPLPLPPNNRRVLIVGGARNIGKTTAEYLSQNGFNVIATSSHPDSYPPLSPSAKYTLSKIPLDIRCEKSVKNFFENVIMDKLDVLIILAGATSVGLGNKYTGDDLRNTFELRVFGAQRCVYYANKYLRLGSSPRVLMITSAGGATSIQPPGQFAYNVNCASMIQLTYSHTIDERILYGTGEITNPITFSLMLGTSIKSTISLYENFKPKCINPNNNWSNIAHTVVSALTSNIIPELPACDQSIVAEQIYNILTAPKPCIFYYVGDPNAIITTPSGPITWEQLITLSNSLSYNTVLNDIVLPSTSSLYTTSNLQFMKNALLNLYFP